MNLKDESNVTFSLAADFINHTSKSVFLTGKAGTGKTTFLKYICGHTHKNFVVAAPTGVAAINAGGVTLHSLFQLPFGIYVPGFHTSDGSVQITNRSTLFKNFKLSKDKRDLLQELELLIIDEVSMVRCDMLDATDAILKMVRKNQKPFGGVQVLFIGDLYQLSPVAKTDEWNILKHHYNSPFFFDAKVVQECQLLSIELKKIYRQNDQVFIDLLNNIRNNTPTSHDFALLNSRLMNLDDPEGYVTLTTHNYKADALNAHELNKLDGIAHPFKAIIDNDFPERMYPTDPLLILKQGVRIMFIKNDTSEQKKYFNGKMATVTGIDGETVTAKFDHGELFDLTYETWRNIRYHFNADTDEIEEEELGSFTQYPIRLAWAITIHKSQGLTFERAIIDAGKSFAAGQVYVALSRCISLQGMVLQTPITEQQISTDPRVIAYAAELKDELALTNLLQHEREIYEREALVKLFDFTKISRTISDWQEYITGKKNDALTDTVVLSNELMREMLALEEVAEKTQRWIERNYDDAYQRHDFNRFEEGLKKSITHFNKLLHENFFIKLQQHHHQVKTKAKMKKHVQTLEHVAMIVAAKASKLRQAQWRDSLLFTGNEQDYPGVLAKTSVKKVSSAAESLTMFKQGASIEHIAETRGLATATIESHLLEFIKLGQLDVSSFVNAEKERAISTYIHSNPDAKSAQVKSALGDAYSYNEIRAVFYHLQRTK
jgi:hypothetical protein